MLKGKRMVAKNDITGDALQTKPSSELYRENYTKIFGKSKLELRIEEERKKQEEKTDTSCET